MKDDEEIEAFIEENKESLESMAESGSDIVRAMALAILQKGESEN
ncbi:MAG: hypothetical protein R6U61_00970 [Thermoplasmata archaeon]